MHPVFRAFKRHYHKVTKVFAELAESGGSFKLEIKLDGHNLQAMNTIPNEEETIRFVVLMRRFLSPSDLLYFGNVLTILQDEFADELSQETVNLIESLVERLKTGYIGLNINGDILSAR